MPGPARPSVLFACVKNAGKSQMAAGLMRQAAGDAVDVHSAGTKPGTDVNSLSAAALGEIVITEPSGQCGERGRVQNTADSHASDGPSRQEPSEVWCCRDSKGREHPEHRAGRHDRAWPIAVGRSLPDHLYVASGGAIDRAELTADLERARTEFHRLLAEAERNDAWVRPTRGTRWNNEQLLLHMAFGYMLVQRLLLLVHLLGRLPAPLSRVFARTLNAATTPFHPINYYGSCAAAVYYNRRRMGAKLDRVIASIHRKLTKESDESLRRGVHFPTGWDPFFTDYMTLEAVYRYPGKHFDFHAQQLTLHS